MHVILTNYVHKINERIKFQIKLIKNHHQDEIYLSTINYFFSYPSEIGKLSFFMIFFSLLYLRIFPSLSKNCTFLIFSYYFEYLVLISLKCITLVNLPLSRSNS